MFVSDDEIKNQKAIMVRVGAISEQQLSRPLAYVDTYGCQQNESDSEKLRGMLLEMGYDLTSDEFAADVILLNTCAVRKNAENRVFGNIGALTHTKRKKPSQIIALCGCLAGVPETVEKIRQSYRHVDIIFAPNVLWRFPEFLHTALTERGRVFCTDTDDIAIAEDIPVMRDRSVKAWLSIMYGCDNFCSYCIVPHVRGRERSRDALAILAEARGLIADGFMDITLLGQNVNSYDGGVTFPDLLRQINDIPGDFLIRFMTSHPKDATEDLFRVMADCEKVARHIHLPFQAGNDRILGLMNRKYKKEGYLAKIDMARAYMPDIVITSDVIVGFPGETDEEFEDTLDVLRKVRFDALFTFLYSKRPGTPAADMPDLHSRTEKQTRFDRLLELHNSIALEKHSEYVGRTMRVLVDGQSHDPRYPLAARTNGGRLVHLAGADDIAGFVEAKITHCSPWSLYGEAVL